MKLNFCTLFDSNYISYGIAMYESLSKHCRDFHLYIFALDDITYDILLSLSLNNVSVISMKKFENPELLKIKLTRTKSEYCWTCSSSAILYCLKKYNLDHCTYIDSDIYFYSDPTVLINEMQDKSVLITLHNYSPEYDQCETSGKYCVQFITFKNDTPGLHVLNWWRSACLEWCYARFENGKFGDQKYLDDWKERFDCVHVLRNFGGGVAPWNTGRYILIEDNCIKDIYSNIERKLYFYHFHNVKFNWLGKMDKDYLFYYRVHWKYVAFIYLPYLLHLIFINTKLHYKNKTIKLFNKWNILRMLVKALRRGRKKPRSTKKSP